MPTFNALDATRELKESMVNFYDSFDILHNDISMLRRLEGTDHRYGHPTSRWNRPTEDDELQQILNQLDDLLFEYEDKIEPKLSKLTLNLERAAYLATTDFASQPKTNPTKANIAKVQKILNLNSPEKAKEILDVYNRYYA